jgi:hypothetical protein
VPPPFGCTIPGKRAALALAGFALCWPPQAHAQRIPDIVVVLAAMPLLAVILAVALGIVTRSWRTGAVHLGLTVLWVLWFVLAAKHLTSDWANWAPIVALAIHLLAMACLIVWTGLRRRGS